MPAAVKRADRAGIKLPADQSARERLLRVAVDIFSRKGYAATSVGEIVAAAGVTKPVLYYHFESKEGLYLTLLEEALGLIRPVVEASLRSDGRTAADRIRRLCQAIVEHALEHLDIVRLTRGLHYAPPQGAPEFDIWEFPLTIKSALERLVEEGVRSQEFAAVPPAGLVWSILGLINVCVDSNLVGPKIALDPRGFSAALDLVLAGVMPARHMPGRPLKP
jgi:TetR/AcrR family transcriptional regulator